MARHVHFFALRGRLPKSRSEEKAELRRAALAARDAVSQTRRIEAAFAVSDHVLAHWPRGDFTVLGGYLPIRSEIDPRPLMATAADRRLRIAVPAIVGTALEFRALERGAPLVPQGLGTYAPGPDAERLFPDILLVPLAAFDQRGHRIGYGGGFYDRAIAALAAGGRRPFTIGLGLAIQEVARVPEEPFDVPLDLVVTEEGAVLPCLLTEPHTHS